MFNKHLIIENENETALYLFVDFDYEFSLDFNLKNKKEKIQTLYDKVVNYIKEKNINFEIGKVFLVVGGLVVGSLFISNYQYSDLKGKLEPKYQYVEQIDIFGNDENDKNIFTPAQKETNSTSKNIVIDNNKEPTVEQTPAATTEQTTTGTNKSTTTNQVTSSKSTTTTPPPVVQQPPATSTTTVAPVKETAPAPAPAPTPVEKMVTLYRYNGTVEQISLEDYVIGVVGAEMPASFSAEALRAQSVLARTYALKKIDQNQVLKDTTSNQVYKDINQLKTLWGADFQTYYNKIVNAVNATKGQYLVYNGSYIEAVYHSTSNGKTEDSTTVWGNSYPYLKSVDSHWDLNASSYLRETEKEFSVLSSIIGIDFNATTNIEILSKTSGDRVNEIKIGDTTYTGIEIRTLLGLRSADFDIKIENGKAIFVTRGYGHGVGMSQYGANGMAKEGYTYSQILSHYYPGTQLKS